MKKQSVRKPATAASAANNRPAAVRIEPKPTGAMATAAAAVQRKNTTTAPAAELALLKRAMTWRVRAEKWLPATQGCPPVRRHHGRLHAMFLLLLCLFHGSRLLRQLHRAGSDDGHDVDRLHQLDDEPVSISTLQHELPPEVPHDATPRIGANGAAELQHAIHRAAAESVRQNRPLRGAYDRQVTLPLLEQCRVTTVAQTMKCVQCVCVCSLDMFVSACVDILRVCVRKCDRE